MTPGAGNLARERLWNMAMMRIVPGSGAGGPFTQNADGAMHPPGRTWWFHRVAAILGQPFLFIWRRAGERPACKP
jgi:hypothetical protein